MAGNHEGIDSGFYQEQSIRWGAAIDLRPYDRGVQEYEARLNLFCPSDKRIFRVADWAGKILLDIGSGVHDRFGIEARLQGVHVVSLNPALRNPCARDQLRGVMAAGGMSVAGLGQELPIKSDSCDAVVGMFSVPHYLHHVDPSLKNYDEIRAAYTAEVRKKDKREISAAMGGVVRVLKPGGKAFFADNYLGWNQTSNLNPFCPSDGTEVLEVLDDLPGCSYEVFTDEDIRLHLYEDGGLKEPARRVIALTKDAE